MIIFKILIPIIALYLLAGCVMAWYESSQTDKPFEWNAVILWLPKVLGIKIGDARK